MARTETELKKLLKDSKEWFLKDIGTPYKLEHIKPALDKLLSDKIAHFVFQRFAHLPGADLVNFIEVCAKDALPPPLPVAPQPKIEASHRGKSTKR